MAGGPDIVECLTHPLGTFVLVRVPLCQERETEIVA